MNYYNEFDPYAAQWLRNLISKGLIPAGDVDERSITNVRPDDLKKYTQCHFFAGIGGWSYALQLAEWPANRPVWTGSCPCQPFSTAGKQKGKEDERHLWPVWFELIRQSRPEFVFGEQVSAAIRHGWWDDVADDLESEGYAVGSAVLPACSVGAPHKRDRLWFVADHNGERCHGQPISIRQKQKENTETYRTSKSTMAYSNSQGSQGHGRPVEQYDPQGWQEQVRWDTEACVWIDCPDGKQRLIEPSIPLLAHGIPNRVGRLRAYGNAIVPQVAAEFIGSYMQ